MASSPRSGAARVEFTVEAANGANSVLFGIPFQTDVLPVLMPKADEAAGNSGSTQQVQEVDFSELMPASIRSKTTFNDRQDMDIIECAKPDMSWLKKELSVPRLNQIHTSLWLAGRPMPPRPLHYQVAAGRTLTVSEDIHFHLMWEPGRMFLKPLPRYLLCKAFWEQHLVCRQNQPTHPCTCSTADPASPITTTTGMCDTRELYKCAYGFLLSYTALIQYESDFHIAASQHLLPKDVDWPLWQKFVWELLEDSPANLGRVNKRYLFGELRASRLNKIIRFGRNSNAGDGYVDLMRGYRFEFSTYEQQLREYLAPILGATAYVALVLTAMQVGLTTTTLQVHPVFQSACYGFTVFAILGPLVIIGVVFIVVILYGIFNGIKARTYFRRRAAFYHSKGVQDS